MFELMQFLPIFSFPQLSHTLRAGQEVRGSLGQSLAQQWPHSVPKEPSEQVWDGSSYPAEPRRGFPQRGAVPAAGPVLVSPGACWSLSCTSGQLLWPLWPLEGDTYRLPPAKGLPKVWPGVLGHPAGTLV